MNHRNALVAEMRRALRLGLPLMAAQVLTIANGLVDTLVAGRIGPTALGAVAIGAGLVFITTIACIGLMASLSPSMAALRAQGRRREVGVVFRQGLWMALAFGLAGFGIVWIADASATVGVDAWGLDSELLPSIHSYLGIAKWSLPPVAFVLAARNVCEGTSRARQVLLVQVIAVIINLIADVTLGLGIGIDALGFEALGIRGIAWATVTVQVMTMLVLFALLMRPTFARFALYQPMEAPNAQRLRQLLSMSLPISLMLLAETGLFLATGIQMAQFGVIEAGAHNIAITMTAAFYMLPLGMSFALTARMGGAYGKAWWPGMRLRALSGLAVSLPLAALSSLILVVFRGPITAMFTTEPAVYTLTVQLMLLAAVFQISDALQAILIGLLRGLQDTRIPMLINVFSYWAIGFGVGWYAANRAGFGPAGLWFGLIAGLSVAALLQGLRLWQQLQRVAH